MAGEHGSLCPTNLFRKLIEEFNMSIIVYAILKALKGLSKTYMACWRPNRLYLDPFVSVMMYSPLWMRHTVMWLSFYTRHLFFLLFQGFFSSHKSTEISVRMIQRQQCCTSRRCSQIGWSSSSTITSTSVKKTFSAILDWRLQSAHQTMAS